MVGYEEIIFVTDGTETQDIKEALLIDSIIRDYNLTGGYVLAELGEHKYNLFGDISPEKRESLEEDLQKLKSFKYFV